MRSDWNIAKWGDIATLEYGKALRGYENAVGPYRVFGTNGPIGWHSTALSQGPSVVIGRKGAYRGVHYAADPFCVIDTAFFLKAKQPFDMRWAYYQLLTQDINGMDSGSAIPSTSRDAFYQLPVLLPPLEDQKRIASILSALDGKIELNRQINQTLEQMAQALFQAWFVDFEPVKAKVAALADGRDPLRAAMSTLSGKTDAELDELPGAAFDTLAATAELFPEEMEEAGEIPKGWEAATLGKYVTPSGVSVTAEDLKGDEAYFGLEHLPRRSIALDAWGQTAGLESGKRRFSQGTILFGKLRPYFHKVGVAPLDGVCSTDILALQPKTPAWFGYALAHLSSDALIAFAERLSNGAKMPRVGWKDLENYPVVAPGEQLAAKFNEHVKASVGAIRENIFQARTLATLRDSLLPKLLSGELAVTPEGWEPKEQWSEGRAGEGRGIEILR